MKKCSFEDPFEAASVYSLNPQVLSVTASPHNPPLTKSSARIHTNSLNKKYVWSAKKTQTK